MLTITLFCSPNDSLQRRRRGERRRWGGRAPGFGGGRAAPAAGGRDGPAGAATALPSCCSAAGRRQGPRRAPSVRMGWRCDGQEAPEGQVSIATRIGRAPDQLAAGEGGPQPLVRLRGHSAAAARRGKLDRQIVVFLHRSVMPRARPGPRRRRAQAAPPRGRRAAPHGQQRPTPATPLPLHRPGNSLQFDDTTLHSASLCPPNGVWPGCRACFQHQMAPPANAREPYWFTFWKHGSALAGRILRHRTHNKQPSCVGTSAAHACSGSAGARAVAARRHGAAAVAVHSAVPRSPGVALLSR